MRETVPIDGFAVWRVATGVGNGVPLREIGESLPGRRLGVMSGYATDEEMPEKFRSENRQKKETSNVNVVFHGRLSLPVWGYAKDP